MHKIDFDNLDRPEIPVSIVKKLIASQFPDWAHLPIQPVDSSGWDNRTFHLGDQMSIRMPSAQPYVHQVAKEQKWLPFLSKNLPTSIPEPLAVGKPCIEYPFPWSIYRWIDGNVSENLAPAQLTDFAIEIANFLKCLHGVDTTGAPLAGPPFFRGTPPVVYDGETRDALAKLRGDVDFNACLQVWEAALTSVWQNKPVWFHGDFSSQNILVKNDRLAAVIDFGCASVGDPACDLVIAWTLLDDTSRDVFRSRLALDDATWARAQGWGIWKGLITLAGFEDKSEPMAIKNKKVIEKIVNDHYRTT